MKIRICVPIPVRKVSDLSSMLQAASEAGADLIEVRLDYLDTNDRGILQSIDRLEREVKSSPVPLIATNRQYEQGGKRLQDEELRVKTLTKAARIGFQYVDIELTAKDMEQTIAEVKDVGAKPIVSFHDFKGTPRTPEMERIIKTQLAAGAKVCKLVSTADSVADSIRCLLLAEKMSKTTEIVCFAMGDMGTLSRVLSPVFGAYFTFASLRSGLETACGQIPIDELRGMYSKLGVDG